MHAHRPRGVRLALAGLLVLGLGLAGWLLFRRLDRAVTAAAAPEREREARTRPLAFRAAARSDAPVDVFGDGTVAAVAVAHDRLLVAGGSGLSDGASSLGVRDGLPSLRASAVASWRGTPVFGLERGGWGRVGTGGVELATTGFGELEVRALLETEAGELLVGARQGLFRAVFAAGELERLDGAPVRALAILPGGEVAAGGETGLRVVSRGGVARPVGTPDPWIDAVGFAGGQLWGATPLGTASGPPAADALALHPRGGDVTAGVAGPEGFVGLTSGGPARVVHLDTRGGRREEAAPEPFRALFNAGGTLLAEGPSGLFRRDRERGWTLLRRRPEGALPWPHVNALAAVGGDLWAGFFDGGVARAAWTGTAARWSAAPASGPWGVNALLASGDAVYVASLRGAFRLDRALRPTPLEGAGGAFSLAATRSGIAVGYGGGVLLPDRRLVSAFHGLPGNQAYALAATAAGDSLWVGTPTGLGRLERRRVTARAIPGEGKLPHPWVTALLPIGDDLLVATYGGGLARRSGEGRGERWERFAETAGVKVNAGALALDGEGRVLAGTVGRGLLRSDPAVTRFDPFPLPLPSPDVYAVAVAGDTLLVGTDQGLARVRLSTPAAATPPRETRPETEIR